MPFNVIKKIRAILSLPAHDLIVYFFDKLHIKFIGDYIVYYIYVFTINKVSISSIESFLESNKFKSSQGNSYVNVPVFFCWLQGYESAPCIVKKCYEHLHFNLNAEIFTIVFIDCDWIKRNLKVPNVIQCLYNSGQMQPAHYSDYIRTLLIYTYGGLWIDSTMLLASSIPREILSNDLFLFSYKNKTPQLWSNQFIYTKLPGNKLLGAMLYILELQWSGFLTRNSYYFYHYTISALARKYYPQHIEKIQILYSNDNHLLLSILYDEYKDEIFNEVIRYSFVHKLTYKHTSKVEGNSVLKKICNSAPGFWV